MIGRPIALIHVLIAAEEEVHFAVFSARLIATLPSLYEPISIAPMLSPSDSLSSAMRMRPRRGRQLTGP